MSLTRARSEEEKEELSSKAKWITKNVNFMVQLERKEKILKQELKRLDGSGLTSLLSGGCSIIRDLFVRT